MTGGTATRPDVAAPGTLRVLVVDDDAVDRQAVRRALAKSALADAEVQEATSVGEAIAAVGPTATGALVDVVLLDYELGAETGLTVLQRIRETECPVPVVMLTGRSDPQLAAGLMRSGATDFLTKDAVSPHRLEQVIRAAVRLGRAEEERQQAQRALRDAHDLLQRQAAELQQQAAELEQQVEESQSIAEELEQSNRSLQEAKAHAERAQADAEQANRVKSEFLANMSHELRTPLNAIGGYSELLTTGIRGPINEAQRSDIERIKRNQHHLLSLINDILNFAKIEAGRVRMSPVDVSLNKALGDLEALVSPQLEQKGIHYEYRCCDESFTAFVDPERLQQILLNLLSNAVKFTPRGGRILVECRATPETMVISVRDTGVGIPPDKLEQVFEPFVQLERGQTSSSDGTGLGLAISRDLARAMRGDLTAVSTVDEGSTFYLTLPRNAVGGPGAGDRGP